MSWHSPILLAGTLLLAAAMHPLTSRAQDPAEGDSIRISNCGKEINSPFADFAPVLSADGKVMFFTSRRPHTPKEVSRNKTGPERIYEALLSDSPPAWQSARCMPGEINEPGRFNSVIAVAPDGQRILIYRDDAQGNGDIYESVLSGLTWGVPVRLPEPVNSPHHESSACYSPDGQSIFLVSSRPGGLGKRDIWRVKKAPDGRWGDAVNIGAPVNTPGEEEGVFLLADGQTLYFSSTGHGGLGGYDIFRSRADGSSWGKPENPGQPLNTPGDDVYFVLLADGLTGFYSSSVAGGMGDQDIYRVEFLPAGKETGGGAQVTLFTGTVYDAQSGKPLEAEIQVLDNSTSALLATQKSNSASGRFLIPLPSGTNYGVTIQCPGYLFHSEHIHRPDSAGYHEIEREIRLSRLETGAVIRLQNIFFEYNDHTLTAESSAELGRLVQIMKDNPEMRIRISGHTDTRGSAEYNRRLSELRAQNVVEYLALRGVPRSRMEFAGMGEAEPVHTESEILALPDELEREAAHRENRRTEVIILSR